MENMSIYEASRKVPETAKKEIAAGRLKGKTDINPMWRIKKLTELFGICGIGWKTIITKQWLEVSPSGEVGAFVNIELYVKIDGEWSEAIPGTGGSMYVSNERNGLFTDDEAYKKAYTDAISVACKALGVGADVYWDKDETKYAAKGEGNDQKNRIHTETCKENKKAPAEQKKDLAEGAKTAPEGEYASGDKSTTHTQRVLTAIEIGRKKGKPIEMKHVVAWLDKTYGYKPAEIDFEEIPADRIAELCKAMAQ